MLPLVREQVVATTVGEPTSANWALDGLDPPALMVSHEGSDVVCLSGERACAPVVLEPTELGSSSSQQTP